MDAPALDERDETRPSGARRQADVLGDLGRGPSFAVCEQVDDAAIDGVEHWFPDRLGAQGDPETQADLLEQRRTESRLPTGRCHPLNPAAPLLDQPELVEDSAEHSIP